MRSEAFDTPGPLELQAILGSADLEVVTWDSPLTEVVIDARRGDDQTRATIDGFAVELHPRAVGHQLVVREPKSRGFGFRLRSPSITVRVRAPQGTAVTLTGHSSSLRCEGALGAVDCKTGSGDVEVVGVIASGRIRSASGDLQIEAVGGQLSVATASGDVAVGQVSGPLSITAVSGDVEVRGAGAAVTVQSVSGDVELGAVGRGEVRVQTVSGDARIALVAGVGAWIDAGSVSGDVTSDLDVDDAPPAETGEPQIELRAKSVSGDITITRSAVATAS